MRKLPVCIITLIILINVFLHLKASNSCMDNSWHLEKRYDYKEYHKTQCNCPCWKYKELSDRGRCSKCLHYHKPEPFGVRKPSYVISALQEKKHTDQRKIVRASKKQPKKPQDLFAHTTIKH